MTEAVNTPAPSAATPSGTGPQHRARSRGRTLLTWTIAVGIIAVAWVSTAELPPTFHRYDGFAVVGSPDSTTASRTMEVTLADLTVTSHVSGERGSMLWELDGDWVVIDVIASAKFDGATLNFARLLIDGVSYPATDRADSLFGTALRTDFPQSGSLAFQVPADVLDKRAELQIATPDFKILDVLLDDVITIPLDLSELPRTDEAVIDMAEWTGP